MGPVKKLVSIGMAQKARGSCWRHITIERMRRTSISIMTVSLRTIAFQEEVSTVGHQEFMMDTD